MTGRLATVFICDDVLISLSGKFNAMGIYTGDIAVPVEVTATQLIFMFQLECDLSDPFRSVTLQVNLPGEDTPRETILPLPLIGPVEGRTRWVVRYPFILQLVPLRFGSIKTKVIHDKGEIDSGTFWVIRPASTTPTSAAASG